MCTNLCCLRWASHSSLPEIVIAQVLVSKGVFSLLHLVGVQESWDEVERADGGYDEGVGPGPLLAVELGFHEPYRTATGLFSIRI